jgi:starch-binding outer membrane protein, SusD/RagB family
MEKLLTFKSKIMKRNIIIILAIIAIAITSSCKKFLEEEPKGTFVAGNFPATEGDMKMLLGGILGDNNWTGQDGFDRSIYFLEEISADEIDANYLTGERWEIDSYNWTASSLFVQTSWTCLYKGIREANAMIENYIPDNTATKAWSPKYIAAAKFFRAFFYFHLVRLYGDVPIMTKNISSFAEANNITRKPAREVYNLILEDLQYAKANLPWDWKDTSIPYNDDGRPTRAAAKTLLAEVYVTLAGKQFNETDKWTLAAKEAQDVMDSKGYSLVTNPDDLWLIAKKNGTEHIWSIQHGLAYNNSMMAIQAFPTGGGINPGGWYYWMANMDFYNKFKATDKRRAASFLTSITENNKTITYTQWGGTVPWSKNPALKKFTDFNGLDRNANNKRTNSIFPIFRYAEVLLLRAETLNEANSAPTDSAYAAFNAIRARAGLANLTTGLTQAQFRDSVKREWSFEMCFEAKRRFNLIRWGDFDAAIKADLNSTTKSRNTIQGKFESWKSLFPIPTTELDINPGLGQNDGY